MDTGNYCFSSKQEWKGLINVLEIQEKQLSIFWEGSGPGRKRQMAISLQEVSLPEEEFGFQENLVLKNKFLCVVAWSCGAELRGEREPGLSLED